MRRPHPSYDIFVKEQKPKYGETFIDWYAKNCKVGDKNLLEIMSTPAYQDDYESISFFRDRFTKKLAICNFLFHNMVSAKDYGDYPVMKYGLDQLADVMDLYEDIIKLVVDRNNVGVSLYPNGIWNDGRAFHTETMCFEGYNQVVDFVNTGLVIIFNFSIAENGFINMRAFKHEALTREVLFEKNTDDTF